MALSKRQKAIRLQFPLGKVYTLTEAIEALKKAPPVKFVESVEVAVNLGVDPRKSEQIVRGAMVLPHGTGRTVRVAVLTQGAHAETAKTAGADIVGFEDLTETIKGGTIEFDILIATPDAMRLVGQLGQILGPRGLMPNPKVGTVTTDVAGAVRNAKGGQIQFRTDKNGIIHCPVGKVNFDTQKLKENIEALIKDLKRLKPSSSKGVYVKRLTVSTTMGPGLLVDMSTVE